MFLLEKLPKEKAQAGSESLGRWHHSSGEGGGRRFGGSRRLALHTLSACPVWKSSMYDSCWMLVACVDLV